MDEHLRGRTFGSVREINEQWRAARISGVLARAGQGTRRAWGGFQRGAGASAAPEGGNEQPRGPAEQTREVIFLPRGRSQQARGLAQQPRGRNKQARESKILREFSKKVRQRRAPQPRETEKHARGSIQQVLEANLNGWNSSAVEAGAG